MEKDTRLILVLVVKQFTHIVKPPTDDMAVTLLCSLHCTVVDCMLYAYTMRCTQIYNIFIGLSLLGRVGSQKSDPCPTLSRQ